MSVIVASAIATGFVGCNTQAQQEPPAPNPVTAQPTTIPVDQRFIEMMIPHHQGAVDTAQIALERVKRPEIRQLAQSILEAQNQEIEQMQTWYRQWYGKEVGAATTMPMDHSMHHGDMGMDMEALKSASDFEREFLRQMIPHHQSAVMMAQMVTDSAQRPEIRNLAQAIIESQNSEIEQMQKWLQTDN